MSRPDRHDRRTRKFPAVAPAPQEVTEESTNRITTHSLSSGDGSGSAREPDLNGMTVLAIDDDSSVRELLIMILSTEGFAVTAVDTLGAAIAILEKKSFDVVITDKNLPDGTGLDALHWIAERGLHCATIIITAYANVRSAVAALRLGVCDYLVKPFDDIELVRQSVRRAARMLALERKNAQLYTALEASNQALASLAVRDPLTKLFNHAYLQEAVEREVARCQRFAAQFSLLFVDLDDFRSINDVHGHAAGDSVLRSFAEIIGGYRANIPSSVPFRPQDVAARYGYDRFVILLPETPKGVAVSKAESLRRSVVEFDFAGRDLPAQAVSIGVVTYPDDAGDHQRATHPVIGARKIMVLNGS